MIIRTESRIFESSNIQQVWVRNTPSIVEVCITPANDPTFNYPIYTATTRDEALSFLASLQDAFKLNYAVFDTRLFDSQQKKSQIQRLDEDKK